MDQKRILWITAAVGVFLLVVIGAALILYSPAQQKSASMAAEPAIASIQAQGDTWVRSSSNVTSSNTAPVVPVAGSVSDTASPNSATASVPVASNTTVAAATVAVPTAQNTVTDINGKDVTVISGTTHVYSSGTTTTIDLNALKNGGTAQIISTPAPTVQNATSSVAQVASTVTTTDPVATVAKPVTKATTTTTKVASTKTTDSAKTSSAAKQYWVQAASFTSKKNAEEARTALTAAEISGEIFTYQDAKGALYYRVRVGPYTTSSEAEYWKARIVKLDMFINSQCYVTNTTIASIK